MSTDGSMTNQKKTGQEGFAILEALIATVVFAIGIVAVLLMQTTSVKTNDIARGVSTQSALAAERMEQLISLPYSHFDLGEGTHYEGSQERYAISWRVDDNIIINNTKTITMTVTWIEHGAQKTINLTYVKPDTI